VTNVSTDYLIVPVTVSNFSTQYECAELWIHGIGGVL